jgi:hypothetical protein
MALYSPIYRLILLGGYHLSAAANAKISKEAPVMLFQDQQKVA